MSDARHVIQQAVRLDRAHRMGVRVGQVLATEDGSAAVNFGRDADVTIATGGRDVYQGQNLLVMEVSGVRLAIDSVPIQMGGAPDVVVIP